MSSLPKPWLSVDDYIAAELAAGERFEYFNGEIFALSGGSCEHGDIQLNLGAAVRSRLKGSNCRASTSDVRIAITPSGRYTYPDLAITCGDRKFDSPKRRAIVNPRVIFEVLSPSTESADRGAKFAKYRTIESFQEYVLISQSEFAIDVYRRNSEIRWTLYEYRGADAVLELPSINISIPLAEIYDDVDFSLAEQ